MFFNSLDYAIFLPIVFTLYWLLNGRHTWQNIILLIASYVFYAWWDYRFLGLLIFSTLLDYFSGHKIEQATGGKKKMWLIISTTVNLGFLAVFKYYNFFIDSLSSVIHAGGGTVQFTMLSIVLPVGISFYTFHGLSYVFDIYYGRTKPINNFVDYSLFVSFFPLLVAGPIERATHLLPQLQKSRPFNYEQSVDGLRQILWGLFKKIVIADNCAEYVNIIFKHPEDYSGSTLVLGAVLFAFQIYGDFSGYSDIALGSARLFGVELLRNFAYPYFSRDIAEFWRRWHISLSSWFRDYLYYPLGGSREGKAKAVRNTFIIFLVSGIWHGANWTFVIWGLLNAIYFLPLLLLNRNRNNLEIVAQGKVVPSVREVLAMLGTFALTTFAWIFFRADNVTKAFEYIAQIFTSSLFNVPEIFPLTTLALVGGLLIVEWLGREQPYALRSIGVKVPAYVRWGFYYSIIILVFMYSGKEQQFIYFQF